jgi:oxygen-independent coproporphyrinogen-3 oxidase
MADAAPGLAAMQERGLIRRHDTGLVILPDGEPYARLAAAAFDTFRAVAGDRFSKAV